MTILEERFRQHLLDTSKTEDGWLSDTGAAYTFVDKDTGQVYFHGEGSIDIYQVAGELAMIAERNGGSQ